MISLDLLSFNIIAILAIFIEFIFFAKRSDRVFSYRLPISIIAILILHIIYEKKEDSLNLDTTLLYFVLSFSYLFGFFNSLAFIKRSITFSILLNRNNVNYKSIDESIFIDLDLRIKEMEDNNWILCTNSNIILTNKGRFILKLYIFFLKFFRVKAIG